MATVLKALCVILWMIIMVFLISGSKGNKRNYRKIKVNMENNDSIPSRKTFLGMKNVDRLLSFPVNI